MITGVIIGEPSPDRQGDTLAADVAAGATVLSMAETAVDFDRDGSAGQLVIGDSAPLGYVSVDVDAGTVTLAAPLTVGYEAGLPVTLWDPTVPPSGAQVVDYIAEVRLPDDPVPPDVVIPHEMIPLNGVDNLVGASVGIEDYGDDEWEVVKVFGREALVDPDTLNRTRLSQIIVEDAPAGGGPGQTVSSEPPPATTTGYEEDHFWWQVVDGERIGTWRVVGTAWEVVEVVTAAAIENLSTLNLSSVNIDTLNFTGGSAYIAQGTAGSLSEAFSGTSLPAGWASTKTDATGSGSGSASVPGASVVSSGPTGQVGSALKVDYGPAGLLGDSTALAAGEVSTSLTSAVDAEVTVRFRAGLNIGVFRGEEARLALRRQDGTAWSSTEEAIALDLFAQSNIETGLREFRVLVTNNGVDTVLGTLAVPTDPTTAWHRATLRVTAGNVLAKVWRDGDAEPAWGVATPHLGATSGGKVSILWQQAPSFGGNSRGQTLWVDELNATQFVTGFAVNPDGTGSWPAIGLGPGDATWRTIGAAGEPAFQNSWVAGTGGNDTAPRFRKEPTNIVRLTGTLQGGASGSVAFTLPVGRRPADRIRHLCWQSNSTGPEMGLCTIETNGEVRLWQSGAAALGKFDIGGVTFSLA